jgi:pimeloyl-ACP methyl ester carboxylesterase
MKYLRVGLLILANVILFALLFLWLPVTSRFIANPQPSPDYAAAIQRVAQLQARDGDDILQECHSILLTHGQPVTNTIVFLHGISNCPAQFAMLGQRFYEMGYNVLIPRLPHHGLADRMTTELSDLSAEELVRSGDEAVDIAAGLGAHVTVVGFSTGGALAAWIAANRAEVDQTVLASPFLSPKAYPEWVVRPLARVLLLLPNQFWWWDEEMKEEMNGPTHAYPRYASHAMAQIMRLGFAVRRQAQHAPPQSNSILTITNEGPRESVDNNVTAKLIVDWQDQGMSDIRIYTFDSSLDIDHDYIDPQAPNQPMDVQKEIYPILIEQIDSVNGKASQ